MDAMPEGAPCWVDAMLPDVEAGKRFYGELFGWTFRGDPYVVAHRDGRRVAGLVSKGDGRMPTVWSVYFAAPDIAALVAAVRDAGGQVITPPFPVGRAGARAVVTDPEGAVFCLWQGGLHLGFERQQQPGTFCWAEVYTRDKALVDPFYEEVFGYGTTDLEDAGADFRAWSPAGTEPGVDTAIGGRSVVSGDFPAEMPAHFLVYFNVDDCDATVETAVRLGGRIQVPPFEIPYGRMAVIHDNQGATFAVLQD